MSAAIPPGFCAVENVEHNPDGSVTVLGRDHAGDPVIHTFPAGSEVTIIKGGAR